MNKFIFILNPKSGKGRGAQIFKLLKSLLLEKNINFEIHSTTGKMDANAISQRIDTASTDTIIAVGGDGTVNEIVNGIIESKKIVKFAVLPIGSGNDFARSVNLLENWQKVLDYILLSDNYKVIDLAKIEVKDSKSFSRYFACNCGIGFEAEVAFQASLNKYLKGLPLYLYSVLKVMKNYSSSHYDGKLDTFEINSKKILISIGNGTTAGGGFKLNPFAKLNDGFLDYCVADDLTKFQILKVLPNAITGNHIHSKFIAHGKFKTAFFEIDKPTCIHIDGEVISTNAKYVTITVMPNSLRTLCRE
ncbi:MAG: diacylglycerol kinase family lipid kinase [Ignavibacteriaceae bacterium]|nr:diacylglycerol kinase family lipid kinase [Ignavibacteriaceae bacterium]